MSGFVAGKKYRKEEILDNVLEQFDFNDVELDFQKKDNGRPVLKVTGADGTKYEFIKDGRKYKLV